MAKKRKYHKHKKINTGPQHVLPDGFWAQVSAILLFAIAILFVVTWFNYGGPVLDWIYKSSMKVIGYAVYIIPAIFVYIGIEIFRAEENRLPLVMKIAAFLEIVWISAIFGLSNDANGLKTGGGVIGEIVNQGTLQLVDSKVAVFIYILLIIITLLFIIRVTPFVIIKKLWNLIRRDTSEEDENKKVILGNNNIGGLKVTGLDEPIDISHNPIGIGKTRSSRPSGPIVYDEPPKEISPLITISDPNWEPPSLDLLEKIYKPANPGDIDKNAAIIKDTLNEFDIEVGITGANVGPRATQYTLRPPSGVKLSRITALETNLSLNLAAQSIRMEAPIPGKSVVGIEVPNISAADVRIRKIFSSEQWINNKEPLAFAIGLDISNEAVVGELNNMPHLLIAGQTGSGKSVMINALLTSLLYRNSPSDLKLILVDPKRVEMTNYDKIPHLLTPVITELEKSVSALKWSVNEMERRYEQFNKSRVKDIKTYNQKIRSSGTKVSIKDEDGNMQEHENGAMPYIVIVIDELADLMMNVGRDLEALVARIAQKGRAAGIHLVLATQTPRAEIITGKIKANIPSRIAFTVSSQLESRIILDKNGAEKLLGLGDMLYVTATNPKPRRIQGAWVTDGEIDKVVAHLLMQSPPDYNDDVINQKVHLNGKGGLVPDHEGSAGGEDPLFLEAVEMVINSQKASASSLQRRFRIGYSRAANIIDSMEEQGIVGPPDGQRPREVLIDSIDDINGADDIDESDDL